MATLLQWLMIIGALIWLGKEGLLAQKWRAITQSLGACA